MNKRTIIKNKKIQVEEADAFSKGRVSPRMYTLFGQTLVILEEKGNMIEAISPDGLIVKLSKIRRIYFLVKTIGKLGILVYVNRSTCDLRGLTFRGFSPAKDQDKVRRFTQEELEVIFPPGCGISISDFGNEVIDPEPLARDTLRYLLSKGWIIF